MKKFLLLAALACTLPACNRNGESSGVDRLTDGGVIESEAAFPRVEPQPGDVVYEVRGRMDGTGAPIHGRLFINPKAVSNYQPGYNAPNSYFVPHAALEFKTAGLKGAGRNTVEAYLLENGDLSFYEFSASFNTRDGGGFMYPIIKGCHMTAANIQTVLADLTQCPSFSLPVLIEAWGEPNLSQVPATFTEIKRATQ